MDAPRSEIDLTALRHLPAEDVTAAAAQAGDAAAAHLWLETSDALLRGGDAQRALAILDGLEHRRELNAARSLRRALVAELHPAVSIGALLAQGRGQRRGHGARAGAAFRAARATGQGRAFAVQLDRVLAELPQPIYLRRLDELARGTHDDRRLAGALLLVTARELDGTETLDLLLHLALDPLVSVWAYGASAWGRLAAHSELFRDRLMGALDGSTRSLQPPIAVDESMSYECFEEPTAVLDTTLLVDPAATSSASPPDPRPELASWQSRSVLQRRALTALTAFARERPGHQVRLNGIRCEARAACSGLLGARAADPWDRASLVLGLLAGSRLDDVGPTLAPIIRRAPVPVLSNLAFVLEEIRPPEAPALAQACLGRLRPSAQGSDLALKLGGLWSCGAVLGAGALAERAAAEDLSPPASGSARQLVLGLAAGRRALDLMLGDAASADPLEAEVLSLGQVLALPAIVREQRSWTRLQRLARGPLQPPPETPSLLSDREARIRRALGVLGIAGPARAERILLEGVGRLASTVRTCSNGKPAASALPIEAALWAVQQLASSGTAPASEAPSDATDPAEPSVRMETGAIVVELASVARALPPKAGRKAIPLVTTLNDVAASAPEGQRALSTVLPATLSCLAPLARNDPALRRQLARAAAQAADHAGTSWTGFDASRPRRGRPPAALAKLAEAIVHHDGTRRELLRDCIERLRSPAAHEALGRSVRTGPRPPEHEVWRERLGPQPVPSPGTYPVTIGSSLRVISLVAEGAFAVVYKCLSPDLDAPVAVKICKRREFLTDDGERRFYREAVAAMSLVHPGIPRIRDVGLHQGWPYIVEDYIYGRTLRELLRENERRLDRARARTILVQLIEVVSAAHEQGVIHRDLKPANILVGDDLKVTVIDWGLSFCVPDRPRATPDPGGTPLYGAPEQFDGTEKPDHRADHFALGNIAVELLTGIPPSRAGSAHGHPSAELTRAGLDPDLARELERLTAIEPRARPESLKRLALLLEQEARAARIS